MLSPRLVIIFSLMIYSLINAQSRVEVFERAKMLFDRGDYAASYELLKSINTNTEVDKNLDATSKYYSADCLLNLKELDGAISEFEYFVNTYKLSNFRDIALYKLGTIYYATGEYRKCRERLIVLLNDYNESPLRGTAYYWVGKSFSSEKRYLEAEEFLKEAVSNRTDNKFVDYSLYSLANLYEATNRYDDAVIYYDELLAYYRESRLAPYAQLRIGSCYFQLREYDKAILELSDPLILELPIRHQNESNYLLANSFFRLKEYENASNIYKQLLSNYPEENIAREVEYSLAWVSFQMQNYDEAYRVFDKLASNGNDTIAVNSLYWSAECKRYLGDDQSSVDIYQKFLNTFPTHNLAPYSKFSLGIIEFNRGKYAEAERFLINSLSSTYKEIKGKSYTLLGEISLKKKDFITAETYFQNAVNTSLLSEDISNRAILGLGVTQFYLSKFDDAVLNLSDLTARHQRFEKDKVNFYLAESYFAQKKYESALRHYQRVDENNQTLQKETLLGRAYSYFNLKDFSNSSFYFNEFLRKYPNDKNYNDAKLRLADSYYGIKSFDKASIIYAEVFDRNVDALKNDLAYYQYGQSLFKAGRSSEAIEKLRTLQSIYRNSRFADDSQYLIGWIRFQQNRFNEAIENYKQIFSRYPQSSLKPIAIYSIGDSYYNLGEYDSALTYYVNLITEYPRTRYVFDALNGIQYCYIAKDEPAKAIAIIDQFTSNNPNSEFRDEITLRKGEIYYSLGDYANAEKSYLEFIQKYPNSGFAPEAYYWLAKSLNILNRKEDAAGYFSLLIEKYLKSKFGIDAVLELGNIFSERKEYQAALDIYDKSLKKIDDAKRLPEVIFEKAKVQIETADIPGAYKTFGEIITYYDETIFAAKSKIELGILEMVRGQYENAGGYFRDLGESRLDDLGAQAQYLLGVTLFEQKKYSDAISAFVRVRSIFSTYDLWYSKSLIMLGDCYAKLNDKKQAREMYRAVISRHSKDELGAEARKKLNSL